LRVGVNEQYALPASGIDGSQIDGDGGFPYSAFLIENANDHRACTFAIYRNYDCTIDDVCQSRDRERRKCCDPCAAKSHLRFYDNTTEPSAVFRNLLPDIS
jgi:hypothetical protein